MKNTIIFLLLLIPLKGISCDCDVEKEVLEFYSAKYVFEGEIISKKLYKR